MAHAYYTWQSPTHINAANVVSSFPYQLQNFVTAQCLPRTAG